MKTILLLGTTVIAGAVRYATEGPILVRNDEEADRLVELGLAVEHDEDIGANDTDEGPDYERDNLGELDLKKADKNQLLVIAAYEKADVPQGDAATKADLVKAIEVKRNAPAS
ncbi:hypothetical protein GGR39_002357 [Novosphingobium fluoreni]|uniref:Uncharacterized protein n=1 Tax=Novosphingobium fluoreni TaxID=1391222 RepID=A0A7W6C221_9SPHN|nr:hypothetical protein [Novosphingobium fluoreni]MBB3940700.1 hypothetical protein [Novosphingobium fluoreni]